MAKILDLHSFRKGKRGQPASRNNPNLSGSGRVRRDNVRPIEFAKGFIGERWPRSSSRMHVNAWAGLLLAAGVLCGLYIGRSDRKAAVTNLKADAQLQPQATPLPSAQATALPSTQAPALPSRQAPAKPSPIVPAEKARVESGVAPGVAADAVPRGVIPPAARYMPVKYEATHKKVFGGCTGQLELTSAGLRFNCPHGAGLNFPVTTIAKAHKDGIELKSGEKYHFTIENRSKEQVEAIFLSWVTTVQPLSQPGRAAF